MWPASLIQKCQPQRRTVHHADDQHRRQRKHVCEDTTQTSPFNIGAVYIPTTTTATRYYVQHCGERKDGDDGAHPTCGAQRVVGRKQHRQRQEEEHDQDRHSHAGGLPIQMESAKVVCLRTCKSHCYAMSEQRLSPVAPQEGHTARKQSLHRNTNCYLEIQSQPLRWLDRDAQVRAPACLNYQQQQEQRQQHDPDYDTVFINALAYE